MSKAAQWPLITVMIPVRNEVNNITRLLNQLYDQDYPRDLLEVIVFAMLIIRRHSNMCYQLQRCS